MLLILLIAGAVPGESLLRYENRVARAAEQIERIKADAEYEESGIEDIEKLLPRHERVEHQGKVLPVDNSWLYQSLEAYQGETDSKKKKEKLSEIGSRLVTLDSELIRSQEAAQTDSREEARVKLRQILDRAEYRKKEESRLAAFIRKIYDKVAGFLGELRDGLGRLLSKLFGSAAEGSVLSVIVAVVALAALLGVVIYLAAQIKPRRKRAKKRTVLGEEIEAGTTPRDLFEAAMTAARAGDYRNAVRKLYISLLYDLSERNLLELEDSATNHEYVTRLSRFTALLPPLNFMTDRFDVSWYGMFPTTPDEFSVYLERYNEAMERAGKQSPEPAR